MGKDFKSLSPLNKGQSLARIATALEHIAFYLGVIVNKGQYKSK